MPLDPATLIARTTAGDAELSAPRHGLAIAQRRLLQLLDQPLALDELVLRPGLQPDRLERDLARLAENGLIGIHRPAGSTGPMFPSFHKPAPGREVPPPVTPTVSPTLPPMLRLPPSAAASPGPTVVVGRRVRHGRALFLGFASLVVMGLGIWFFATPSTEPVPRQAPTPAPTASPPPARPQPTSTSMSAAPAKAIEPVRVLHTPDPAPSKEPVAFTTEPVPTPVPRAEPVARAPAAPAAPALVFEAPAARPAATPPAVAPEPIAPIAAVAPPAPPALLAVATPTVLETRIAPLSLTPVTREVPDFPREALQAGVSQGTVKARVTVDAAGRVTGVDIVDAQPRRVFDRAVTRSLARWTFAPGESGRATEVEIAFRRE